MKILRRLLGGVGLVAAILAYGLPESLSAQSGNFAERIYEQAAPSVFVILIKDANGTTTSLGSGFLIGKNRLVTNFHVVGSGAIFIKLGVIEVPASVENIDPINDLAIVHTSASIGASPLTLSSGKPSPGENVFVIGNPEGLEKSISTGIISATRDIEDRPLLQITAPISHGSSGGPVLNSVGEVIGISVGMLTEGQNLNFAVPVAQLRELLAAGPLQQSDTSAVMQRVKALEEEQNHQQGADWEGTKNLVLALLRGVLAKAGNNQTLLLQIAEKAQLEDVELAFSAAEAAVRIRSDAESNFVLGKVLKYEALIALFNNAPDRNQLLERARQAFALSVKQSHPPSPELYFNLGDVSEDLALYPEAEANFLFALKTSKGDLSELAADSVRGLARVTFTEKKTAESEAWFKFLVDRNLAQPWDWSAEAKRRAELGRYQDSGDAFAMAGTLGGSWADWCEAANWYSAAPGNEDSALSSARKCISDGAGKTDPGKLLALAHDVISGVLNRRGVYSEALAQAVEAIALDSTNPFYFEDEAEALLRLRRFAEAIEASNHAIRLSDGKFSHMHFRLGNAYFELQNWELARQSFEKAAELNQTDTAAPYNVALCLTNLGYRSDAVRWYEEVLRRNPNYPDRAEIRRRISALRAGL